MEFIESWGWPEWLLVLWMFIATLIHSAKHGKPMVHEVGEDKGKPQTYNGFTAFLRALLLLFLLVAGGFFA